MKRAVIGSREKEPMKWKHDEFFFFFFLCSRILHLPIFYFSLLFPSTLLYSHENAKPSAPKRIARSSDFSSVGLSGYKGSLSKLKHVLDVGRGRILL